MICRIEQLVARRVHTPEVAGSSPSPAIEFSIIYPLANSKHSSLRVNHSE